MPADAPTSYYTYDGHGSTRALTDPNGEVTDTYDYDAFGNLIHSTATGIPPGLWRVGGDFDFQSSCETD